MISFEQKPEYIRWTAEKLNIDPRYFGACATISVMKDDKPVAVCVYSSFNGVNCELTVAATSKRWLRKETLQVFFKYPFNQLGCKRITLMVNENNKQVSRLAKKLGFTSEGTLRKFMNNLDNCLVFGLLKEECRYL